MENIVLYKFRNLGNLKFFLDILLNERLYAARYDELNDPMEGHYLIDPRNSNLIKCLRNRKYQTRICSLTKDYRHTMFWSHYADSHCGCVFEISISNKRVRKINYEDKLPVVNDIMSAEDLLLYKSKLWEYENEYRVFSKSKYIQIKIERVIFGLRVPENDFKFYKKLINAIHPRIEVRQIKRQEIIDGFFKDE